MYHSLLLGRYGLAANRLYHHEQKPSAVQRRNWQYVHYAKVDADKHSETQHHLKAGPHRLTYYAYGSHRPGDVVRGNASCEQAAQHLEHLFYNIAGVTYRICRSLKQAVAQPFGGDVYAQPVAAAFGVVYVAGGECHVAAAAPYRYLYAGVIRLLYVIRAFRIVGYAFAVYLGYDIALLYARGLRRGVLCGKVVYHRHILAVGHKYDHGQHHCQKYIHKRAGQHHYHALPYRLRIEALGIGYTFILTVKGT